MLRTLSSILTPSAAASSASASSAAADSLAATPRSSAEGHGGFATLMQQQADLRLSDRRLADQRLVAQRQTESRGGGPSIADGRISAAPRHEPVSPSGSSPGAGSQVAEGPPVERPSVADPARPSAAASPGGAGGAGGAGGTAGAGGADGGGGAGGDASSSQGQKLPLDGAASRNAASLTLEGKLRQARSAAQDASRRASAGATPLRAGAKPASAEPTEGDSGTGLGAPPLDGELSTAPALAALPVGLLPPGPDAGLPIASAVAGGVPQDAAAGQAGASLSVPGRTGTAQDPAAGSAAEGTGGPGGSRSIASWVAGQPGLRNADNRRSAGPAEGKDAKDDSRTALLAASAGRGSAPTTDVTPGLAGQAAVASAGVNPAASAAPTAFAPTPAAGAASADAAAGIDGNQATSASAPAKLPGSRRSAEPEGTAGPLTLAEAATSTAAHPANSGITGPTRGAGLDSSPSRHPADTAAGDATLAAVTAAATAATGRSPGSRLDAVPVEVRIAAPIDSPAFAPALGAQISLFARDGVQTARLQLNPAEMGPIAVQIAVDGNAARIEFQADRAATREVIEASLPSLAGALQDAGLTLSGGGVFQQHPGRQAPPEPGPAPASARLPSRDTGLDAVAGGLAASSRQRTPRGLVDLMA